MHIVPVRVVEVFHLRLLACDTSGAGGGVLPGRRLHVCSAGGREREAGETKFFEPKRPRIATVIIHGENKR